MLDDDDDDVCTILADYLAVIDSARWLCGEKWLQCLELILNGLLYTVNVSLLHLRPILLVFDFL